MSTPELRSVMQGLILRENTNYCFRKQHISRNQANRWRSEPALLYSLNPQLINPMPKVSDWVYLILDDGSQNGIHRIWCVNCSGI